MGEPLRGVGASHISSLFKANPPQNATYCSSDIRAAIDMVRNVFHPETAGTLIRYFHECLSEGLSFEKELLTEYIYHVLDALVKGHSGDVALGLAPAIGRPAISRTRHGVSGGCRAAHATRTQMVRCRRCDSRAVLPGRERGWRR